MEALILYKTILVTGCGGDIGQSVGKILKHSAEPFRVIGCDIHDDHAGKAVFDFCSVIRKADSPDYLDSLRSLVLKEKVDLIIPTSEPELRSLMKLGGLRKLENIPLLCPNLEALEIGFDKLATVKFLQRIGLQCPWTKLISEGPPEQLPCIAKGRYGAGGKDVQLIKKINGDFDVGNRQDFIWQEYLQPDDQEYTCGVYRSVNNEIRLIAIKRKLQAGITVSGEIIDSAEIDACLVKLAEGLELRGSINVQLRLTERGPVIFEINPRFSSTVYFRHLLGYRDLLWAISECEGTAIGEYRKPEPGTKIYRISNEVIINPNGIVEWGLCSKR